MSLSAIYDLRCDWTGCDQTEQVFANDVSKAGALPAGWADVELYDAPDQPMLLGHLCPEHLQALQKLVTLNRGGNLD